MQLYIIPNISLCYYLQVEVPLSDFCQVPKDKASDDNFTTNPNSALLVPLMLMSPCTCSIIHFKWCWQLMERSRLFSSSIMTSSGVGFSAEDGVRSFTGSLASEAFDHGSTWTSQGCMPIASIFQPSSAQEVRVILCQSHKVLQKRPI